MMRTLKVIDWGRNNGARMLAEPEGHTNAPRDGDTRLLARNVKDQWADLGTYVHVDDVAQWLREECNRMAERALNAPTGTDPETKAIIASGMMGVGEHLAQQIKEAVSGN